MMEASCKIILNSCSTIAVTLMKKWGILKEKVVEISKRKNTYNLLIKKNFLIIIPTLPVLWVQTHIRSVRVEALTGASGKDFSSILCSLQDHRPAKSLHRHHSPLKNSIAYIPETPSPNHHYESLSLTLVKPLFDSKVRRSLYPSHPNATLEFRVKTFLIF